uniref:Protein FAR1-RELATED SEQUENCE n=1 Tax=Lactuca sativa TaxID=4236 RepID=A0A9R1WB15_LACSA|nr:hypothetical protein LSAT_V11C200072050 [Lactuca sativa]
MFIVLCRPALTIIMKCCVKEIPEKYILKRWRQGVISRNYHFSSHESDFGDHENLKLVMGVSIPIIEKIHIHVPQVQRNKGSENKKGIPNAT